MCPPSCWMRNECSSRGGRGGWGGGWGDGGRGDGGRGDGVGVGAPISLQVRSPQCNCTVSNNFILSYFELKLM